MTTYVDFTNNFLKQLQTLPLKEQDTIRNQIGTLILISNKYSSIDCIFGKSFTEKEEQELNLIKTNIILKNLFPLVININSISDFAQFLKNNQNTLKVTTINDEIDAKQEQYSRTSRRLKLAGLGLGAVVGIYMFVFMGLSLYSGIALGAKSAAFIISMVFFSISLFCLPLILCFKESYECILQLKHGSQIYQLNESLNVLNYAEIERIAHQIPNAQSTSVILTELNVTPESIQGSNESFKVQDKAEDTTITNVVNYNYFTSSSQNPNLEKDKETPDISKTAEYK